jgi:hypothetical protein
VLLATEIVLLAFALIAFAPDAPLAKRLRRWLIEAPVPPATSQAPALGRRCRPARSLGVRMMQARP